MSKKAPIRNTKLKSAQANNKADAREGKKHCTITMPVSLHIKLKIASAKRGETMGDIICHMLEEELKDT